MAYIFKRKNGSEVLAFKDAQGRRRALGLAGVPPKVANTWILHIEAIVTAQKHQTGVPEATARWIETLGDEVHERLSQLGLLRSRQHTTLGSWLEYFLASRRQKIKASSIIKLEQTCRVLLEFFDPQLSLKRITADQAGEWSRHLARRGLARATIRIHHGNARSIFNGAIEAEEISKNPFQGLPARTTPSDYRRHIADDEIARVIEHASTTEWKLLLGLARYAGLRVPSETHLLRPEDIDLARGRMLVRSPKTEHHAGHESRSVPIDPRLSPLLSARLEEMGEGETALINIPSQTSRDRAIRRFCLKAGVEPWQRTWQTLRASAEIDWASRFPQFAVSKWIGHSMLVSERHYANHVPDEIFSAASGASERGESTPTHAAAQRQAQRAQCAERKTDAKVGGMQDFAVSLNSFVFGDLRESSSSFLTQNEWSRGGSNP